MLASLLPPLKGSKSSAASGNGGDHVAEKSLWSHVDSQESGRARGRGRAKTDRSRLDCTLRTGRLESLAASTAFTTSAVFPKAASDRSYGDKPRSMPVQPPAPINLGQPPPPPSYDRINAFLVFRCRPGYRQINRNASRANHSP